MPKKTISAKPVHHEASMELIVGQPLYQEIKRKLYEMLHQGVWTAGQPIPSESALKQQFNVSIGTIRKAVDELVASNVLVRHQGRGTFVVSHDSHRYFFSFFRLIRHDGQRDIPSVELLHFEAKKADVYSAERLGIGVSDKVYCFTNRLSLQGVPMVVDEITVPAAVFPQLNDLMLRHRTSTIYSFYQQAFGVSVVRTAERIRAVAACSPYTQWLSVANGCPLMLLNRIAYTYRDRPVELRRSFVNTAHHEYDAETTYRLRAI